MNFRTSPAVITPAAAQRLPRVALVLMAILYVLPGLLGREPWKPYDGANLGLMIQMADGAAHWLVPNVPGLPIAEAGWLPYWLGAVFIWALPFLDPALASRIPLGLAMALTLVSTWYATYHLARSPGAQPVPFAFGGQASSKSYACAMADASLLALIASLGLAHMGHEFSLHPFATACVALLFWAFAKIAVLPTPQSLRLQWGMAAIAVLGLLSSGYPGTAVMLVFVSLMGLLQPGQPAMQWRSVRQGALGLFIATLFAYFIIDWPHDAIVQLRDGYSHIFRALKTVVWFAWPSWPLAIWAVWRWRAQHQSPHISIPTYWLIVLLAVGATAAVPQRHLMLTLPIFASLAVFALPTLKRSGLAFIDWVALLFFTTVGFVIWFYWVAFQTGSPTAAANAVSRLLPGFDPDFSWLRFGFAVAMTCAWVWMIRWRTRRQQHAIWKGLVLSASGTIWVWGLLMSLWLPVFNYGMGYDTLARQLSRITSTQQCVHASGLPPALFAALQRQRVPVHIHSSLPNDLLNCQHWIVGDRADLSEIKLEQWAEVATVRQLNRRSERIRVFKRVGSH
jgi:4-amino-4-deoxy-L-arabinose transferase-like glycosyltransferase